jgi:hypothetical protein
MSQTFFVHPANCFVVDKPKISRLFLFIFCGLFQFCNAQHTNQTRIRKPMEIQLTSENKGHLLNTSQCFSKDNKWIVYDGRNIDDGIQQNGTIAMVNVQTKEIRTLYTTSNQTEFGPGVGAATFSPVEDRVLFIHGIRNANKQNPYSYSRRTGASVLISNPGTVEFLDARNITPPFTAGALRGGTHAHSWSADGNWVSFTYNDFVIDQLSKKDSTIKDLRVVAVMNNSMPVNVPDISDVENNNGKMFAAVVTDVTDHPTWGSDEIDKAFDEGWVGTNGYLKKDGTRRKRAIAFQGNVRDNNGQTKTELFIADISDDITKAKPGCPIEGTMSTRPCVPAGVSQRRLTFLKKGIVGPRFWVRTTPDGKWIGFLTTDEKGIVQIYAVSPNGGPIRQLTFNDYPIEGPFNFSPDGNQVAYIADNSIFVTNLKSKVSARLTHKSPETEKPEGPVVWSNDGRKLAFNRYLKGVEDKIFLQIFLLVVK